MLIFGSNIADFLGEGADFFGSNIADFLGEGGDFLKHNIADFSSLGGDFLSSCSADLQLRLLCSINDCIFVVFTLVDENPPGDDFSTGFLAL